jgi:thymidylate synthase ThyX
MLTQERQAFGVDLGYLVPNELIDANLADPYREAIERACNLARQIAHAMPESAQYVVPMACLMRWRFTLNLREAFHLCELRSSPQGHPTYRAVAQQMYGHIVAVHPELASAMRFVDTNSYELERLESEKKLDRKRQS